MQILADQLKRRGGKGLRDLIPAHQLYDLGHDLRTFQRLFKLSLRIPAPPVLRLGIDCGNTSSHLIHGSFPDQIQCILHPLVCKCP